MRASLNSASTTRWRGARVGEYGQRNVNRCSAVTVGKPKVLIGLGQKASGQDGVLERHPTQMSGHRRTRRDLTSPGVDAERGNARSPPA